MPGRGGSYIRSGPSDIDACHSDSLDYRVADSNQVQLTDAAQNCTVPATSTLTAESQEPTESCRSEIKAYSAKQIIHQNDSLLVCRGVTPLSANFADTRAYWHLFRRRLLQLLYPRRDGLYGRCGQNLYFLHPPVPHKRPDAVRTAGAAAAAGKRK